MSRHIILKFNRKLVWMPDNKLGFVILHVIMTPEYKVWCTPRSGRL